VGTDGSDGADLAVSHAVAIGSALGWSVIVAAVSSAGEATIRGTGTPLGLEEARAVLGDAVSRHGAEASGSAVATAVRPIQGLTVTGPVGKALVTLAREEGCRLLVVGNRRDSARPAGLAAALADEAPCDLLVVDTLRGRRPAYRRIGAVGGNRADALDALVRGFSATVDSLPRPAHGRWPVEVRTVDAGADLSESGPYDLLVLDRDGGARSRGALGRLIESAGTNVLVLRTHGTEARVRPGRRGKEQRMARGGPEALVDVPLFSSLSKRHLRHIAALTVEEQFAEGSTLAEEGKPGDTFYVLLEGEAKVVRSGRRMDRLIPGDFFGEIALIDGGPRTASVVATTPITTLTIERKRFRKMLEEDSSIVVAMLEELAKRLRNNERSATG
jgi:nucleotide-binding universal stress UspA family protein